MFALRSSAYNLMIFSKINMGVLYYSLKAKRFRLHYTDVIMSAIASQITSLTIVYSAVYSGAHQRKHQSSASLAFVRGIHWWPLNSPHKGPVTRKISPIDDVIMFKFKILQPFKFQVKFTHSGSMLAFARAWAIWNLINHWPLGDVAVIEKVWFSSSLNRIVAWTFAVELFSGECLRTSQMGS